MIVLDLDGTLISRSHEVSPADLSAVERARSAGLFVTICTGRSTRESMGILSQLKLQGEGVFVTGATISDLSTGGTIVSHGLSPELVAELTDFFSGFGHAVLLLVDPPAPDAQIHYVITSHGPVHAATQEWLVRNKMHASLMDETSACRAGTVLRAGIVVNLNESAAIIEQLTAKFAGRISFLALRAPLFDCHVIEVFAADVNKWTGVKKLCSRMGIPAESVAAVGDDVNDISMLRGATMSYAMGNATAEVQAAAKRITRPQSQNGVAAAIDRILRDNAAAHS